MLSTIESSVCTLLVIFTLIGFYSCGTDEECLGFPAEYSNTENILSGFDPVGVYVYDGQQVSETGDNPDDLFELLFPADALNDFLMGQQFTQRFSILNDSLIEATFMLGDIDTTILLKYQLEQAPNFYTVYSETDEDIVIGGVEIAEDCSFVDVCRWFIFAIDESNLDNTTAVQIQGCYRLSEDNFEEESLQFIRPDFAQRTLLLIRDSQILRLEE